MPAMAGAQAVDCATITQDLESFTSKGNDLHQPMGFHPSQFVLNGRCRNEGEFED